MATMTSDRNAPPGPSTSVRLGAAIRHFRLKRKWAQARLAREVGLGRSMVCEVERGRSVPNVQTLDAFRSALGLSWAELLGFAQSVQRPRRTLGKRVTTKLTPAKEKKILRLLGKGELRHDEIACRVGVSKSIVWRVRSGFTIRKGESA